MGKKFRMSEGNKRNRKKTIIVLLLLAVLLLSSGVVIVLSQTYTIRFHSRGGENLPNMTASRKTEDLPIPVRPGQTFLGWSKTTTPGGDTKYITSTRQLGSSTDLYAHWKETNYVINFFSEGEQINQLGFNENTAFTHTTMTSPIYSNYWMPEPQSESGHAKFMGWAFKDISGNNAWLWYDNRDILIEEIWTLQVTGATPEFTRLTQGNSFLPQLYDSTMHAVWEYKGVDIYALQREGGYSSSSGVTNADYGSTIDVGAKGSLSSDWYLGDKTLVGWKIGFLDDQFNRSPLKIDSSTNIVAIDYDKESLNGQKSDLTSGQLQQINDLLDKVYPISMPFYVDPLLAYLSYQEGNPEFRTHKLFIYPVVAEGGSSLYYDARFNLVTESGTIIKRVGDGTKIQFGLPRARELETFVAYYYDQYDSLGVKLAPGRVTRSAIENAIRQGQDGVIVETALMHPKLATVFYEEWEKNDVKVTFDYGAIASKNKKGFYGDGVRKIHDISYEDNDTIKAKYRNAAETESRTAGAGDTIVLPSASMFIRPNMNFIGWQEEVGEGMQPGRIYPAGYEYVVSSEFGLTYKLNAVWSDSQVNFSFNLAGGRGFNPDLSKMRGNKGSNAVIPTEKPTRFGYTFEYWVSDRAEGTFAPGATIAIKDEKQILTAVWSKKQVTMTMNFAFSDISDNEISGSMVLTSLFDQTVRLQAISPTSTLTNVKIKEAGQTAVRDATAQEITEIKANAADNGRFNLLYKLVGWTFRNPNNVLDPRAVTFGATQAVNLNERVVREDANGKLRADAFQEDEKNTVALDVYAEYGSSPIKSLMPVINSFPRLTKNDYSNYVKELGKDKTHDFVGFFALPKWVTTVSGFDMSHYWDNANGEYKIGSNPWVVNLGDGAKGQLLRFYGSTEGGIAGREGEGVAQNFRINESMNYYFWLKPKAVNIDYYGIVTEYDNSNNVWNWRHTDTYVNRVQSYFDDQRSQYRDLGSETPITTGGLSNLERIPSDPNFFFLNWTVEYYYTDGFGVSTLFETETIDLMLNPAGIPTAPSQKRLLQTGLKKMNAQNAIEAPVSRIVVKPNMQSVYEFVVRVIDDGRITGTPGTAFNIVLPKEAQNIVQDDDTSKLYVGGQILLDQALILEAKIQRLDPLWGAARWPRNIYGAPIYGTTYWDGFTYVGPASETDPFVSLGDLLDDKSKKIVNFNDKLDSAGVGIGNVFEFGQIYKLHAKANDNVTEGVLIKGHIDVRSGAVSLYPILDEITYIIQIMNDTTPVCTIAEVGGISIKLDDVSVLLDRASNSIKNANVTQPGFYFDERENNLSTINYLAEGNNVPRNQRTGMFKIGGSYKVGKLYEQIPPPTSSEFNFAPKTIMLYIVWLPCDVTLKYEHNFGRVIGGAQRQYSDIGYMVGSTVSLFGNQTVWLNDGYTLEGWALTDGAAAKNFNLGSQINPPNILLSHDRPTGSVFVENGVTKTALNVADVVQSKPSSLDTSNWPYKITVTLYPYWQETYADTVTFDFSPLAEDAGAQVELMPGNRFLTNWNAAGANKFNILNAPYGKNIGNIESNWMMFKYTASGQPDDFRMFGGWYYTDVSGNNHNLNIVNGQLTLDDIFLAAMVGNQPRSIVKNIVIKARWVTEQSQLFQFDIANEAIKTGYTVTDVANGSTQILVSVHDGFSGDAEFLGQPDSNSVPYVLAYNKYIGPEGKQSLYPQSSQPQFYRTEVAVEVIGADGTSQKIVKALNPMYEKLNGQQGDSAAPVVRKLISVGTTLERWETRRIPTWSTSQMDSNHDIAVSMNTRLSFYNTGNASLANYAKFEGREGTENTAPGAGFTLNNIYQVLVQGSTNGIITTPTNDSCNMRFGYELVGFAITDEFNNSIAFGNDPRLGGASNTYINNYLFSPRPVRIMLVPIYMPREVTLTLKKEFGSDTELRDYTKTVHNTSSNYDVVSETNTEINISTYFDEFIDLPFLETRGYKNPLLDKQQWLMAWKYGAGTNEFYAVYGDVPDELLGNLSDNAIGFQVKHSPDTNGGNLVLNAIWGTSTRMEVNFHVLMPEPGKLMSEWTPQRLYFDSAKINEIAGAANAYGNYSLAFSEANRFLGDAVLGSVAEHYRKPILRDGAYDYSQATYTIPKKDTLDSAFILPTVLNNDNQMVKLNNVNSGLRSLGWFMEHEDDGLPLIKPDPTTGLPCVAKTLNNATGNYDYEFEYSGGAVDRVWKQDGSNWNIVNLSPQTGGAVQSINVYLVYDYVEGTVVFNGGYPDVSGTYPSVFGKYSYQVALPGAGSIIRHGKDFYGWTKDFALKRMRNYYQTIEAANAPGEAQKRTNWEENDFVKIESGPDGNPAIYRYHIVGGEGTLEPVTIYKNTYKYSNPVHGGIVNMYAVWEERIIVHTFRDGTTPGLSSIRIWGDGDSSHNSAYGLETGSVSFQNGITSNAKYFYDNIYGEEGGVNSVLPIPTKEGYKFLYWVDTNGLERLGTNIGDASASTPPDFAYLVGSKCEFQNASAAILYAVWVPYYYAVEFDTNNVVAGQTTDVWSNVVSDINTVNPDSDRVNGRTVTLYSSTIKPLTIPEYRTEHFVWSDPSKAGNIKFLGWTPVKDNNAFLIDTTDDDKTLSFWNVNNDISGIVDYTVKVGILNKTSSDSWLTYVAPDYTFSGDKYVRTVKLYAFWEFGEIGVNYFDDDNGPITDSSNEIHAQDAYLLNPGRTAIGASYRLVVPSLDNDYMQYGVMVADESIIPAARLASKKAAGQVFGGWRVMRGPSEQVQAGKIYYPGDFLDGTIRENIDLEAVWYVPASTTWNTLKTSGTISLTGNVGGTTFTEPNSGILVMPTPDLGANNWDASTLEITNPNIHTVIFPRITNGTIAANSIIAHNVSRIVLPSVDMLIVAPQAIHSENLQQLYLGDNLVIIGNPVAGRAAVNQTTGEIVISSAMTAYLVQQGAQKFVPDTGSGAEMKFAIAGVSDDPDNPETYIRGGNKNKQSTKFSYMTNRNYFGALYSLDKITLFAYPGAAASISLDTNVRTIKSYALAYMAGIQSSSDLFAVATNAATSVEAYAVFHTNARTIRLPSVTGSSIVANAISGYQPNLRNVYFGTTGTANSSSFAHVDGNILYHGASGTTGTLRTNVMYVLRHAVAGNAFAISSRVTNINDYALSSFYIGTSGNNVTTLTVEANINLDIKHFINPNEASEQHYSGGEARGQHTFYLNIITLNGLSSVDHRIFRGTNQLTRLNVNSVGIDLVSDNYTLGQNEFPIFVPTETVLNGYMLTQMEKWGRLKYSSGDFRMQTFAKAVNYSAGSANLPDLGVVSGSGSAPSAPLTVNYDGSFTIPQNTFIAPLGTSFIGWRVASNNSAIDGKIYQPGWTFTVGKNNSLGALNNGPYVAGANIYIQSSITLTAVWEVKKIQFIDKDGARLDNQTVLLRTAGTNDPLRAATNMELAGKKLGTNGGIVDDLNTYSFFLVGANLTPVIYAGDSYSFVGWIERANANSHPDWQWSNNNNIVNRFIPDSVDSRSINLTISNATSIKYFHALYDISSGNNVTYTASGTTNASARATSRTGSGDIGIPAAVIDTSVNNVVSPQGFMKRVTVIEASGFQNMTHTSRTKVYIGGSVEQINSMAFMGSKNILTVVFGHNYTSSMPGLTIGSYAFGDMKITSIKLPLVTTSIGTSAFADNLSLTSVTFDTDHGGALADAKLTSIGAYAFWSDRSLTQIFEIPKGVTSIGTRAFVSTGIAAFASANASADGKYFVVDGNLCYRVTASNVHLVMYAPGKAATSVGSTVFTGIHRILSGAFSENYVITSISIPSTVTYIEAGAFEYSVGIQTITLGHSVPSAIHGGNTPAHNPFSNTTAVILVNANATQLAQWRAVAIYNPSLFVSTQP